MFQITVSPDFLAYLLAGLLAILFDWFPGLSAWFGQLSEPKKRQRGLRRRLCQPVHLR